MEVDIARLQQNRDDAWYESLREVRKVRLHSDLGGT